MKITDLRAFDAPVLLFGGPYSNLQATQAVFDRADQMGIPPARRICTGDVVAYCGAPAETIAEMQVRGGAVVAGNCEKQLAARAADCGCGFDEGTTCDVLSIGWYGFADGQMTEADRAWMADAPDIVVFSHHSRRVAVIHGGVTDIARFIWSTSPEVVFHEELTALRSLVGSVDMVIAGHSGIPFVRQVGGVEWINAGVIGMPPNDGARDTRFVILENGKARIEALTYDWPVAQSGMRAVGLTHGYDRALESGYWPSEDVLPPELRRASASVANG